MSNTLDARGGKMLEGILTGLLVPVLLFLLGAGCFLWRRRRLLSLFGVSRSRPLTIYLSRVEVLRGGSRGPDGLPRVFSGPTVTASEANAAAHLAGLFEYLIPGLESQPGLLKTLFTRDIPISVEPSPLSSSDITSEGSIVTVGSPGYNVVSAWAQDRLNPKVMFSDDNGALVTNTGRRIDDPTLGLVQVLYDAQSDRPVFWAAGITEAGTRVALLYLSSKWDELRKRKASQKVFAGLVQASADEIRLVETID
jgi:hypothetical protein